MGEPVYQKEKLYFIVSFLLSIVIYIVLVVSIVGIIYILIGGLIALIGHGLMIGNLKGNGVKVSENQFSEIYHLSRGISDKMEFREVPDIFVIESGGMLNAFATKFLGRNFVVLYSDILELAYQKGEEAVAFIVAHELVHLKRHMSWRLFLYPSMLIPFLGTAYSRACEYTCDLVGAYYVPKGAIQGLLVIAAGKNLYHRININEICNQAEELNGFWVWISEKLSTHPNLTKRINFLCNQMSLDNQISSQTRTMNM